jgi:hypothetical protein
MVRTGFGAGQGAAAGGPQAPANGFSHSAWRCQPWAGGQGAGCAEQVVRHGGDGQPGGVGGELPRGQVRQRPVGPVGEDLLDDGVAAVVLLGLDGLERRVGEDRMVPLRRAVPQNVHVIDAVRAGRTRLPDRAWRRGESDRAVRSQRR